MEVCGDTHHQRGLEAHEGSEAVVVDGRVGKRTWSLVPPKTTSGESHPSTMDDAFSDHVQWISSVVS